MKIRWVAVLVLAAIAGTWYFTHDRPESGNDAVVAMMESGKLSFTAQQVSPTEVRISVQRMAGSDGDIQFVIPAGTIVYPSRDGTQRMAIAAAVAVNMSAAESIQDYSVEAYCLDQFLDPPEQGDLLSFYEATAGGSGGGSQVVSDSGVDVSELMPCLEEQGGNHSQRQFALWIVEGDYLDLAPGEAEERMFGKYAEKLRLEAETALRSEFRNKMLASMPGASSAQVDAAVEQYIASDLGSQVSARARRMAHSDITGMRDPQVQSILATCNVETENRPLFA
jgi:hypothetical protein